MDMDLVPTEYNVSIAGWLYDLDTTGLGVSGGTWSQGYLPIGKKSSDGKTYSWYLYSYGTGNTYVPNAGDQLNQEGVIYHYLALG